MSDPSQIVIDIDPELKDAFLEAAKAEDRAPADVVRDLISNYLVEQDDPNYWAFVAEHVEAARKSLREGKGIPNAEVEAHFAARRAAIRQRHG